MTHKEFKKRIFTLKRKAKKIECAIGLLKDEYSYKHIKYPIETIVTINGKKGWIKGIQFNYVEDYSYVVAGFKKDGDKHMNKIIEYFANESELSLYEEKN